MADDVSGKIADKILWVAVIGAGPAGYYTAEALTTGRDDVRVDIIDRLPTPFGLIRAGVAPDHQSIKNVAKRYSATNDRENVRFVGNLSLGRDITLKELQTLYDVVVLATGAAKDRELGLDGENLTGIIGSSAFVSWYNSHPDFRNLAPDLKVASVAVIGNGNVAIDVARVLAKTADEMTNSDLAPHAADQIHGSPIRDIYVFGRRGPLEASFTPKEMGELNELENCVALVDEGQLPDASGDDELAGAQKKNMIALRKMAENKPDDKNIRLHLMFYRRPMAILGDERVCGIRLEKTRVEADGTCTGTGETETLPVGLIVPCIGYKSAPIEDVPYNERRGRFENDEGLIADRLYCVGWARRGPTGTIGTNKPDGVAIAKKILEEVQPSGRGGRVGLDKIVEERDLKIVTFADWKKIDEAETSAATDGAPRVKFASVEDMIEAVDNQ
ncbi:FAD-dependent oxidoreductase [Kordiimonas sp. SCSIO 12610]|uniref:FAD-dependent oxidoreductase n=1 Tax=Kordiimonas sp. SCSIO 12610 TaxID=2829597 RepID=UPI00210D06BE|nr:FAD-dependent oxidoreductase [Kordiimonas sp. SCSIO 12610]UTW56541.1 FAD-dependent oxidoreductase [Kordiimonas sp. SCSIO 12610]